MKQTRTFSETHRFRVEREELDPIYNSSRELSLADAREYVEFSGKHTVVFLNDNPIWDSWKTPQLIPNL